jgi:hypothetical protein
MSGGWTGTRRRWNLSPGFSWFLVNRLDPMPRFPNSVLHLSNGSIRGISTRFAKL